MIVVAWPRGLQNPSIRAKTEGAKCPLNERRAVIDSATFEFLCFPTETALCISSSVADLSQSSLLVFPDHYRHHWEEPSQWNQTGQWDESVLGLFLKGATKSDVVLTVGEKLCRNKQRKTNGCRWCMCRAGPKVGLLPGGDELYLLVTTVLWLCPWFLCRSLLLIRVSNIGPALLFLSFFFSSSPPFFHVGFEVVLDALWIEDRWGEWGRRNRVDLCLSYIAVLLLTGVSMQLCGRAHLHTERRRKEEWEERW